MLPTMAAGNAGSNVEKKPRIEGKSSPRTIKAGRRMGRRNKWLCGRRDSVRLDPLQPRHTTGKWAARSQSKSHPPGREVTCIEGSGR